jgi:hypothetical protein
MEPEPSHSRHESPLTFVKDGEVTGVTTTLALRTMAAVELRSASPR